MAQKHPPSSNHIPLGLHGIFDDILLGHPHPTQIEDLLTANDKFITILNADDTDGNCGRQNTFCSKMESIIKTNTMFRITIRLHSEDTIIFGLRPQDSLATSSHFGNPSPTSVPGHPVPVPASIPPPAAPNNLDINAVMDLKNFNTKCVPALTKTQYIHRCYNLLHSRGRICGMYTILWEAFTKASYMGDTWTSNSLDHIAMDHNELMSAVLHGVLSATYVFHGDCKEYAHLISNCQGNGYLDLYQIVHLTHPLLGQVTVQKEQPQHRKIQPFSEHISHTYTIFSPRHAPAANIR
jgi:hypothetical protein